MKKPDGYDEAKASGEFTPVKDGGHYAVIKQVSERQSSTGKDMVVVLFDFCEPDTQTGYFADMFNNSDKEDKKWPFFLTLITSLSIEIVQMVIGRVFDVDDIILNIIGGLAGYYLYYVLRMVSEGLPSFCRKEWFLNILSILLLIGLIVLIM